MADLPPPIKLIGIHRIPSSCILGRSTNNTSVGITCEDWKTIIILPSVSLLASLTRALRSKPRIPDKQTASSSGLDVQRQQRHFKSISRLAEGFSARLLCSLSYLQAGKMSESASISRSSDSWPCRSNTRPRSFISFSASI